MNALPIQTTSRSFPATTPQAPSDVETALLWQRLRTRRCQLSRQTLIAQFAYFAKVTAGKMVRALPPHIEFEDVVSMAYIGLIKAVDTFDPERGVQFSTYAITLIRGAILEGLRSQDWIPRLVRDQAKNIRRAEEEFEGRHNRVPDTEELAEHLQWDLKALLKAQQAVYGAVTVSLEDALRPNELGDEALLVGNQLVSSDPSPYAEALANQKTQRLAQALDSLPTREREVMQMYYLTGKTFKAIGAHLSLSESRVYQIHAATLAKLRRQLIGWEDTLCQNA